MGTGATSPAAHRVVLPHRCPARMGTRAATAFERAGTRRLRVAWALAIVGLSACDAERREPAFISRDSAGIEIVESLRCSWGSAGPWSVDARLTDGPARWR